MLPEVSRWMRRIPDQNRRTQETGGSKYISGIVSQCVIGSPPPCCTAQNRSISTSQPGRSPRPIRSYRSISRWYSRKAAVTSRGPAGVATEKFPNSACAATLLTSASRPKSAALSTRPRRRCSALCLARLVGAQAMTTRWPVITRRAISCPRRCDCHEPSGVRPDSDE